MDPRQFVVGYVARGERLHQNALGTQRRLDGFDAIGPLRVRGVPEMIPEKGIDDEPQPCLAVEAQGPEDIAFCTSA